MNFKKGSIESEISSIINTSSSLYSNFNSNRRNSNVSDFNNEDQTSDDDDNISENSTKNKLNNLKSSSNKLDNYKYYHVDLLEDENYCIIDTSKHKKIRNKFNS
jgi:hypothetical protein